LTVTDEPVARRSGARRVSAALYRRPRLRLAGLLGPPSLWIGVVYIGSLLVLLRAAFWSLGTGLDSGLVIKDWSFTTFRSVLSDSGDRSVIFNTLWMAIRVTVIDTLVAFPVAYYLARVAAKRTRGFLLAMVLVPLWASYLVKVYAFKTMFANDGVLDWMFHAKLNLAYTETAVLIVLCYLWLPFVILPIYAALERVPRNLTDASGDLGARPHSTFRHVILPLAMPGIVAGSIFSFSLTLGDYIAVKNVGGGKTQFIGNVIEQSFGTANNAPLGATMAFVALVIIAVYLFLAKLTGAFEAL
jgi:putative spermidine/putrescine transport system permease protein